MNKNRIYACFEVLDILLDEEKEYISHVLDPLI